MTGMMTDNTKTEESPILARREVKVDINQESSEERRFSPLSEVKGFLIGVLSSLLLAISSAAVNQMKQEVHPLQLNGYRYLVIFFLTLLYFCWKQMLPRLYLSTKHSVVWFVLLLICNCGWAVCNFASVEYISIGIAGSITQVGEVFLAAVAICIISRRMIGCIKLLSVFLGTFGILCLHQKFIFFPTHKHGPSTMVPLDSTKKDYNLNESHHQKDNTSSFDATQILGGILAASAAIFSLIIISIFSHKLQDLNLLVLFFWTSLFSVVSSFLLAWLIELNWILPDNTGGWILFSIHCICFVFGCCVSWLPLYFASVFVTTLSYTTMLVFLFLIQWSILGDISSPPGLYIEIAGGILVMVSSFSVPLYDLMIYKCKQREQ